MIYQTTSIKNVISRVLRNNDNKVPGHFLDYMLEWIPEAMEELETPFQVVTKSTPNPDSPGAIVTKNHVASLPCGLVHLIAVENENGYRIREGQDVSDITSPSNRYSPNRGSVVQGNATDFRKDSQATTGGDPAINLPGTNTPWDGSDIVSNNNSAITREYYKLQMGHIQTSLESMFVKLHYTSIPLDEEGYPLVPDISEYKEAVYWYIMSKMVGAGFKHSVIPASLQGIEYCNKKFEEYAGIALGKIRIPTQDKMARIRDGFAQRLVPPNHFYSDFGVGGEQVQPIL